MTVFYVIEKQQKSCFCLQFFFTEIIICKPKSQHSQQNSVLVLALEVILFALIRCWAELQPLILVHTGLASIFNITTALHAGK